MAEPKPLPACASCDHICEDNPLNADQECWGRMTGAERVAFGQLLVAEAQLQQHAPQELPPVKIGH